MALLSLKKQAYLPTYETASIDIMPGGGGGDHKHHHHHHHHNHHLLSFHLPHLGKKEMPPKGCMAIRVGGDGEEPQRFVVPVMYLNHPLFLSLLKEAEEEYGFEHKGPITIPCHVAYFLQVQGIIDRDTGGGGGGGGDSSHHQQHQPLLTCFRA